MKKIILSVLIVTVYTLAFSKSNEVKTEAPAATPAPAKVAQIFDINGIIKDKVTNEVLVGVEVKLEGTNLKAYTDFDGKFTFNEVQSGEYNLVTSYISYKKNVVELANIKANNKALNIKLEASN